MGYHLELGTHQLLDDLGCVRMDANDANMILSLLRLYTVIDRENLMAKLRRNFGRRAVHRHCASQRMIKASVDATECIKCPAVQSVPNHFINQKLQQLSQKCCTCIMSSIAHEPGTTQMSHVQLGYQRQTNGQALPYGIVYILYTRCIYTLYTLYTYDYH